MKQSTIEIHCDSTTEMQRLEDELRALEMRSIEMDGEKRLPVVNSWLSDDKNFRFIIWVSDAVLRQLGTSEFIDRAKTESVGNLPRSPELSSSP